MTNSDQPVAIDFIRRIINEDLANNKHGGKIQTRFPPEPNGFLHIGHAKSICLNFGIAEEYAGAKCYLRFDDTNPEKEKVDYVEAIKQDVRWLGYDWEDRLTHASDYFEQLYQYAEDLIRQGKAYVCGLSQEQIRETRGSLTEPGQESPDRHRSIDQNLDLFRRMRAAEFADGTYVLRAKIDMASPNINLRDPVIYRIKHHSHPMTGDRWCIYPMYDYTHCLSDALEGITHSLCTLEFEDHRPLYDWYLDQLEVPCHPQQIEFSRLALEYTVVSKRVLNDLLQSHTVNGWDDPRMPTLSGLRRRGFTAAAVRDFCSRIGVTKKDNVVEMAVLENCQREALDPVAPRVMAVLDPLKVVIENYPQGQVEELSAANHPNDPRMGSRTVPFSREIYIERGDFMEDAPRKFFRLSPGREVRLRYAYYITCREVIKNQDGEVVELICTYDPESRGGSSPDGRKVKGTLHWVSAGDCLEAEVRLYDRLFTKALPLEDKSADYKSFVNPESLVTLRNCRVERSLAKFPKLQNCQFERQGYFCLDSLDSAPEKLVFNRTVTLRDTWGKKRQ